MSSLSFLGNQYSGNGIFAVKRQKLCQLAHKLFLDGEELNFERSSRLTFSVSFVF